MDQKESLCIQFIFILFTTTLVDRTRSFYPNSSSCIPQNCGNGLNIEYPFWIPGLQEYYCGLPDMNITCSDNKPVLKISDDDYIVKDIFYANNSVLLAQAEVLDRDNNNKCPLPRQNFSIEDSSFSYGPKTADLYFFYNCTKPFVEETFPVDCASNASHHAFAIVHTQFLKHWNYSEKLCQAPVNAPIATEDFDSLLDMNYTEVLKKGFVLQWDGIHCNTCQGSGGHCGSYYDKFACFCANHIDPLKCYHGSGLNVGRKVAIAIGATAFGAIIMCFLFLWYQRRQRKRNSPSALISRNISSYSSSLKNSEKNGSYFGVHVFSYEELEEATKNFDSSKILGDGGFGTVYKGELLDGRVVAVKRLYENNCRMVEQFITEVEILTRMRHRNLVSLYGCTSRHSRELLLVYEYIPNGTVADHLHGALARPGGLPWSARMSIAVETASALAYLHASDIIHRDVKTNNILLDKNFSVKVADFGLSRLFPTHVTHISTAPQGTPGYVDPEYHDCYQLTDKSDVFSFGVVLIELISSKPAVDIMRHRHEINLSNMAINKIQNHALHELVDPDIGYESDCKVRTMICLVAELAFQCLQHGRDMRPSMHEVLKTLEEIQKKEQNPSKMEVIDIPADDVVLLSNGMLHSPDSVVVDFVSRSTTSNSSN